MYRILNWLMMLLLVPSLAFAAEVPYSAVVLDISGKATASHQGTSRPLELGAMLYPQELVETAAGAALTINYLDSGAEEQWPGGLKFAVGKTKSEPLPPQVRTTKRQVILPPLEAPPGGLRLRGRPRVEDVQSIGVKGLSNSVTLEDRPTFSWDSISGAARYRVALFAPEGDKPLWQQTTTWTGIPYPHGQPSLTRGRRYVWEVEALKDGKVIAKKRSCFSLPASQDLTFILKQQKKFTDLLANHPEDTPTRLAFIFFLETHRLYDEAAAQYAILRAQRKESQTLKSREERWLRNRSGPCNLAP